MERPYYVQKPLSPGAPDGVRAAEALCYTISLGVDGGQIALTMAQAKSGTDYIAVTQDCTVEIVLDGDQLFFSKVQDGITTKEELSYFYGGLEYDSYDEKLDRYKVVRFTARYNAGGRYDTIHPFNVNVDFLQSNGENGPKWIALTIDPDIKNPPPIHT